MRGFLTRAMTHRSCHDMLVACLSFNIFGVFFNLITVVLLRSLTQTMQCGVKKGYRCSWPPAPNHTSCCHKCRFSRGKKHSRDCISRMPDAGTVALLSENFRELADAETPRRCRSDSQDAESNGSRDRLLAKRRRCVVEKADSGQRRGLANAEESSAGKCIVCFEIATHALIPCGHMCLCDDCAPIMVGQGTCPICRGSVQKSIHIYQS